MKINKAIVLGLAVVLFTVTILVFVPMILNHFKSDDEKYYENLYIQKQKEFDDLENEHRRLEARFDTLSTAYNELEYELLEDLLIIEGLKNSRDEAISGLDTMHHSSLYKFFSNN